jgi:hypothetical protein
MSSMNNKPKIFFLFIIFLALLYLFSFKEKIIQFVSAYTNYSITTINTTATTDTVTCSAFVENDTNTNSLCGTANKMKFSKAESSSISDLVSYCQYTYRNYNDYTLCRDSTISLPNFIATDSSACQWSCTASNGTENTNCSFIYDNPKCGFNNGGKFSSISSMPTTNYCNSGYALTYNPYQLGNRWVWTCTKCQFTYGNWQDCDNSGNNTRRISSVYPTKCTQDSAITTDSCFDESFNSLKVDKVNNNSITLSWNQYSIDGFSYKIVRSETDENPFYPVDGYIDYITGTFYNDTKELKSGVIYNYRICAVNSSNKIKCSNVVKASIPTKQSSNNINGACGTNAASYATTDAAYPTAGTFCSAGTAPNTNPAFPELGGTVTWSCAGSGTPANCTAIRALNGACGSVNGTNVLSVPAANLCSAGTVSFYESEPYKWTCNGLNGGNNIDCQVKIDGSCNSNIDSATSDVNPCTSGTLSGIDSTGTSWNCLGINDGKNASCGIPKCGNNAKTYTAGDTAYSGVFCAQGTNPYGDNISFPEKGSMVSWSCVGSTTISCSASRESDVVVNGLCGSINGTDATTTPVENLCITGTASAVSGLGPWSWTCSGVNGSTASCSTNYICGNANNSEFTNTPTSNLCSMGLASKVSETSSLTSDVLFKWTCGEGDNKVNCSATKIINNICGLANGNSYSSAPNKNLCSRGTASTVSSGEVSFTWTCTKGKNVAKCSAKKIIDGICGTDSGNDKSFGSKDFTNLCNNGNPSDISISSDGTKWVWDCNGINGGEKGSCSANIIYCSYTFTEYGECDDFGKQHRSIKAKAPDVCVDKEYVLDNLCQQ